MRRYFGECVHAPPRGIATRSGCLRAPPGPVALPYDRLVERWVLFLHLATVLGFMLAHGVQVTVMWRIRAEADPEKQEWLFHSLPSTRLLQVLTAAIVVTGLIGGIVVPYWRQWWMWLSLVLLLAITWAMRRYGGGYFGLMETPTLEVIEAAKSGAGRACRDPLADGVQAVLTYAQDSRPGAGLVSWPRAG